VIKSSSTLRNTAVTLPKISYVSPFLISDSIEGVPLPATLTSVEKEEAVF